jgi:hypothetical protein
MPIHPLGLLFCREMEMLVRMFRITGATAQQTAMSSRRLEAVKSSRTLSHVVTESAPDELQTLSASSDSQFI